MAGFKLTTAVTNFTLTRVLKILMLLFNRLYGLTIYSDITLYIKYKM